EAQFHRIIAFHIRFGSSYHSMPAGKGKRVKRLLAQIVAATLIGIVPTVASSRPVTASQDHTDHLNPPDGDNKSIHQPAPEQRALGIYQPWSDADIDFMTGMTPHHAQAVIMAGWATSHGARKDVRILCERMVVGQADEILSMQTWLKDRGLPVPDGKS